MAGRAETVVAAGAGAWKTTGAATGAGLFRAGCAIGAAWTTVGPPALLPGAIASGGAVTGALRLTTSEGRFTAARTAAPNVSATTTITRILLSFSPVSADPL